MRQRAGGTILNDASMVEDFLEFACRRAALTGSVSVIGLLGEDKNGIIRDQWEHLKLKTQLTSAFSGGQKSVIERWEIVRRNSKLTKKRC